jgi:hypothetical protein
MEVQLFDTAGNQIPSASLRAALTSTWDDSKAYGAHLCIDGNPATFCHSREGSSEMLRVTYQCPSRFTSLSKVVVLNRMGAQQEGARIASFSLEFVNFYGTVDRGSFQFVGVQPSYTFTPGALRLAGTL